MDDFDQAAEPGGFKYDPNSPPDPQQILSILDTLKGISDEDREKLREELLQRQAGNDFMAVPPNSAFNSQMLMLMTMLLFLTLIFVFFGYKLYKSLTEKERKRDEKKKMKQQKKRK